MIKDGMATSAAAYERAQAFLADMRKRFSTMYETTPVIALPAATGAAPRGLSYTGDARLNSPWTALGAPAISVPMPVREGLPLGLQLTADRGADSMLLRFAVRAHQALHGTSLPNILAPW